MSYILQDTSPAAIAGAAEANTCEHYANFRNLPGAEIVDTPEFLRFATGVPLGYFNGVLQKRIDPAHIDSSIVETISFFQKRQHPFWWWLMPTAEAHAAPLVERLVAHGLNDWGQWFFMALDLTHMREEWPTPPGLTIQRVTDDESLKFYTDISGTAFENPLWPQSVTTLFRGLGLDSSLPYQHYLARLHGEPVATASIFYGGGVASLQHVAVPLSLRRQGIGTAITLAPLRDARALGYRVSVLVPTELGYGVYKRVGFEECCKIRILGWKP